MGAGSLQALWQRGKPEKNVRKSQELGCSRTHTWQYFCSNTLLLLQREAAVGTKMETGELEFRHHSSSI